MDQDQIFHLRHETVMMFMAWLRDEKEWTDLPMHLYSTAKMNLVNEFVANYDAIRDKYFKRQAHGPFRP